MSNEYIGNSFKTFRFNEPKSTGWNPNFLKVLFLLSKIMSEIKEVGATSYFEIVVECPHCNETQERTSDLTEELTNGSFSADDCDTVLTCENDECEKEFRVTEIIY